MGKNVGATRTMKIPVQIKGIRQRLTKVESSDFFVYALIAIYTIIFSYITIARHSMYKSHAWDLGIFDQALWSTLNRGKLLWNTPELGSHFGWHFQPILLFILPIYWIYQSPLTLLVVQSLFIGLGAIPLYWLARKELNRIAGIVFAALYLLHPALHGVNYYDFHPEAFMPILLLFSFFYFREGKWVRYFAFLLLALMCKETVPIFVVFLGLYFLWLKRKALMNLLKREKLDKRNNLEVIYAFVTIILGLSWFAVAITIISHFNPQGYVFLDFYSRFGEDFPSILFNIFRNPICALEVAFTPLNEKLAFLVALFASLAFLSFLDAPSLSIAFPYLATLLLSSSVAMYQIGYQYPAPIIPFIFVSAIYGVKRLVRIKATNHRPTRKTLFFMALCSLCSLTLLCSQVSYAWIPTRRDLATMPLLHKEALDKCVSMIPPYASVATQGNIFPHLSHRLNAYSFFVQGAEYILVDSLYGCYLLPKPLEPKMLRTIISDLVRNDTYGIMVAIDGIWLLKMGYNDEQLELPFKNGLKASFYNNLEFGGEVVYEELFFDLNRTWDGYSLFAKVNGDHFSLRVEGYLHSKEPGNYVFKLETNGISRLYIEQQLVFESNTQQQNSLFLEKGYHKITIEFIKSRLPATLKVYWKPPWTGSMEIIPTDYLYLSFL